MNRKEVMESAAKVIHNLNKPARNPRQEFCELFKWALTPKQAAVILDGWLPYSIELNSRKIPDSIDILSLYDRVLKQFSIRPIVHSDDISPAAVFHFSADNYFEDEEST